MVNDLNLDVLSDDNRLYLDTLDLYRKSWLTTYDELGRINNY